MATRQNNPFEQQKNGASDNYKLCTLFLPSVCHIHKFFFNEQKLTLSVRKCTLKSFIAIPASPDSETVRIAAVLAKLLSKTALLAKMLLAELC